MAVSTSNVTLSNLCRDNLPFSMQTHQGADVADLLPSNVIKVEDDRIGLAAIHAGMFNQVVIDLDADLLRILLVSSSYCSLMLDSVGLVVL